MTRWTAEDFRRRGSRMAMNVMNMVRRVVLGTTAGGLWQALGYQTTDFDEGEVVTEGEDDELVDVFQGTHIYARPAAGNNSEAILIHVGGEAEHPTIAATRDEDARLAYVDAYGDIAEGEVVIYNSTGDSRVLITVDGDIEITSIGEVVVRSPGGTTEPVVLKSEFDEFISDIFNSHDHGYKADSALPSFSHTSDPPDPTGSAFPGSTVLKTE